MSRSAPDILLRSLDRPGGQGGAFGRGVPGWMVALMIGVSVTLIAVLIIVLVKTSSSPVGADTPRSQSAGEDAARAFLDAYVDSDGRVVRHDQGGDTVSEGQAYGMLLAQAINDRARFDAIWAWTRKHLERSDGLLSWQWNDGRIVGASSAADADLDVAWALALGARRWKDPELSTAARAIGRAIADHEVASVGDGESSTPSPGPDGTTVTGRGRTLTAGQWASFLPYTVNPSYFNPAAEKAMAELDPDGPWEDISTTQRVLSWQLIGQGDLPPDWADVNAAGTATPAAKGSDATQPVFSLDAARFPFRMAISCVAEDRELAASLLPLLSTMGTSPVGRYTLTAEPLVTWTNPVMMVAQASAADAAGDAAARDMYLSAAVTQQRNAPSYYGAAWLALGLLGLTGDELSGCA